MERSRKHVIYALELGGTHTRFGVSEQDRVQQTASVTTPQTLGQADDPSSILELVRALVDDTASSFPPMEALAVSVTGMLRLQPHPGARSYGPLRDYDLILSSPNIGGMKNISFLALLESAEWNVPIHVEHDVNSVLRAAIEVPTALGVNMGTGIGAAVKRNNKIQHFGDYWSGYEIGHGFRWSLPDELVRKCACGAIGCLESVIGARALSQRYGVRPEHASSEIYEQMRNDVVTYLAPAIADTANGFGLDTVALFGKSATGFSSDFDLAGALQNRVRDIRPDRAIPAVKVISLPELAGLEGAVLALLDNHILGDER